MSKSLWVSIRFHCIYSSIVAVLEPKCNFFIIFIVIFMFDSQKCIILVFLYSLSDPLSLKSGNDIFSLLLLKPGVIGRGLKAIQRNYLRQMLTGRFRRHKNDNLRLHPLQPNLEQPALIILHLRIVRQKLKVMVNIRARLIFLGDQHFHRKLQVLFGQ